MRVGPGVVSGILCWGAFALTWLKIDTSPKSVPFAVSISAAALFHRHTPLLRWEATRRPKWVGMRPELQLQLPPTPIEGPSLSGSGRDHHDDPETRPSTKAPSAPSLAPSSPPAHALPFAAASSPAGPGPSSLRPPASPRGVQIMAGATPGPKDAVNSDPKLCSKLGRSVTMPAPSTRPAVAIPRLALPGSSAAATSGGGGGGSSAASARGPCPESGTARDGPASINRCRRASLMGPPQFWREASGSLTARDTSRVQGKVPQAAGPAAPTPRSSAVLGTTVPSPPDGPPIRPLYQVNDVLHLWEIFNRADASGDGCCSADELQKFMQIELSKRALVAEKARWAGRAAMLKREEEELKLKPIGYTGLPLTAAEREFEAGASEEKVSLASYRPSKSQAFDVIAMCVKMVRMAIMIARWSSRVARSCPC